MTGSTAGATTAAVDRRRTGRLAIVGGAALALGLAGIAMAWTSGVATGDGGTTGAISITMRYSTFSTREVTVQAGAAVTFRLTNDDPIDHEWLIGDESFHARHRNGTDAHHGGSPDEVSVPAGTTVTTTITFRSPGEYSYICHLPGHEAYGMVGVVRVVVPAG